MRNYLRKTWRITAATWSFNLAYRGDVILWTIADAITPLIALGVWYTVSVQGQTSLTPRDTLTYYILTMLVLTSTNAWIGYYLTQEILYGSLARKLIRPIGIFWEYIADNLVVKTTRLAIPLGVFIIVASTHPNIFSPSIYNGTRIVLAIISIIFGAAIAFLADSVLASLAFWVEDVEQILGYHHLLYSFTSGIIIPFAFLPSTIKAVFSLLPYRYIISAPVEILVTSAQGTQPLTLIAIQLIWIATLVVVLRVVWFKGLKIYAIPGQ